jgi:translation initiation factor IF-2
MEKEIGKVTHFWGHISVAGIDLTKGELKVGDIIHIKGTTTDFTQKVESIHIEDNAIEKAKIGDSIGVGVNDRVREHDVVYLVTEE